MVARRLGASERISFRTDFFVQPGGFFLPRGAFVKTQPSSPHESAPKMPAKTPHPIPSSLCRGEREEGEGSWGEGAFSCFGCARQSTGMSDCVKA